MEGSRLDVALIADDVSSNSLGRVFCLWQLARAADLKATVLATRGDHIWGPLQGTEFASAVRVLGPRDASRPWDYWSPRLLLPVKPMHSSAGLALRWARERKTPLLLDIDDPDLEAALAIGSPARALAKWLVMPRRMSFFRSMWNLAPTLQTVVSNPVLQERYGGMVIPHVREDWGVGSEQSAQPSIAFVGTVRGHKGVEHLRQAVASVQDLGYRLTVTATSPPDAKPWEDWVGSTTFSEGMSIVADADVVVVPSEPTVYSEGQLPAKLIDAMMLGRAVVASDLRPHAWALGEAGELFPAGDVRALREKLRHIADRDVRTRMGLAAADRARNLFTVDANVDRFRELYESMVR